MNIWGRFLGLVLPAIALLAIIGVADPVLAMTPQVAAGKDFTVSLRSDGTIWSSGGNDLGQLGDGTILQRNTPVQAGLPGNGSNWTAIAAGVDHTVAIRGDGTLWGWGSNDFGQLGKGHIDPHLVPTASPVQIGNDADWTAVAAGASCTLALKSDGTLWAWGLNNFGQLGNGDPTGASQTAPVPVQNPGASVYTAVSISNEHVLALQADGTLWTWGSNQFGQLGINTVDVAIHATPVQYVTGDVNGFDNAWSAISAGGWHSVAQQSDGSLWSWGRNHLGQLGNGSGSANNNPLPVRMGSDADWAGFCAGEFHTVAFKRNGTLWSWGADNKGQLGSGGATDLLRHSSPVQITIPAGISNITATAAGSGHSIAFNAKGELYAWGDNLRGQLGVGANVNNVTTSSTVPLLATQNVIGWVAVDAGGLHTVARRSNGTLWAWGDNTSGQGSLDPLDTGNITNPVQVGTVANWATISGGQLHTAAIRADGTLWTWGNNVFGQLGDGTSDDRFTPQQIVLTSPVSPVNEWFAVSSGDSHTLALQADGSLWTWGDNSAGQLGDGTTDQQLAPKRVVTQNPGNFDNNWVAVSAGTMYSVGLQADGTMWAWGDNSFGQLGSDPASKPSSLIPIQVINFVPVDGNPGFNSNWTAIAAGFTHLLGLQANGTIWGVGANSVGQLGNGASALKQFTFVQAKNPNIPVVPYVAIAAGDSHSVALKADGSVWSWGNNTSGQLGIGTIDPDILNPAVHADPERELTSASDWVAISAGNVYTVALKSDGTLASWGDNANGQLGDGTTIPQNSPTPLQEGRIGVPAAIAFGSVALAGPYPTTSITISNTGNGTLAVSSVAVTGANNAMFPIVALSSTCLLPSFTLNPGVSCKVDVSFVPGSIGSKSANLTIITNDPLAATATVLLGGSGYVPFIITATAGANGTISPSGSVPVPASGSQLFTIVADPGAKIVDVVVDGISLGPVGSYLFNAVSANGHTIAATFTPVSFLDSWSWRNPLPTAHSLRRVATNGAGVHIAVGDYGTILRSIDGGTSWTMIDNGSHTLNGVAFGSGIFVAVGSHGRVLTSPDGLSWTSRHTATTTELQSVIYGNGVFVVVGNTQTDPATLVPSAPIFTSADGVSWTPRLQTLPLNTAMDLHDVSFGSDGGINNVFVAAGQGGYLLKSSDNGVTWLLNGVAPINPALQLPLGIAVYDFYDIHFAANTFVAVGASGQVYTSGLSANAWTQHDILSFADLKSVTYNNAQFVAVGATGEIWSSTDGASWNQQTSGLEATQLSINSVTLAGSGFLAVGDDGRILTSTDGTTWAIPYPQSVSSAALRDVVYVNGIYTAVGDVEESGTSAILGSPDGAIWTRVAVSPATHNLQGVAYGNGVLVAVGDSGIDQTGDPASRPEILTSADNGTTWSKRTVATTPATSLNLYGVAFGGNQFVAVGDWDIDTFEAIILTSPDGISWTRRSNPSPDILRRITYVDGQFVAVGGVGTVLVSADGITWANHSISFGPEFTGIAVKPGVPATLAAVGTNSTKIYRSTDNGSSWTIASQTPGNLPTSVLRGITYADGYFVAVAESGFIFSSTDAITWTTRMGADIFPFGTRELFSVTFGNGRFLATGFNGTIMQSSADAAAAAQPALSLSPTSLVLAPVEIGTSVDTVFSITNRGGADLNVATISSGDVRFTIQNNNCVSALTAGANCTFTVSYTPVLPAGTITVTSLSIASDDPASPQAAVLQGTSKDTLAPDTTISANPAAITNVTSADFSFTSPDGSATFECKLDAAAFASCSSPLSFSGLAEGSHTFQVRARDAAGNSDATPASYTWSVDTTAPDTSLIASPVNLSNSSSATFSFTSPDGSATFECKLDGAAFAVCSSPAAYSGLADSSHTFQVRARDAAGNTDPTPASATWSIDTVAPDVTITSNPAELTNATTASFDFTSTDLNATFECSYNLAVFTTCSSPAAKSGLPNGVNFFQVRARDAAGNMSNPPAAYVWTIDTVGPSMAITSGPVFFTNSNSLTVSGTVEVGAQVAVSVNTTATAGPVTISGVGGTAWSSTISSLVLGVNTITVTATDTAGNTTVQTSSITFDTNPFVNRTSDATTGSFIQPLYNTAAATETLQLRSVTLTENPVFDRAGISLNLNGGYDVGFANANGVTFIKGRMVIRQGTVRVNKVKIH